ncbi:flagellar hook-associated protein FlgK [Sphingomonas sp.]|uniref:flagellar hook-associated protein FlgK n=1 Tax=Sphingomonas sp. TaxID=28214 RepID=UPI0025DFC9F2|nr:flagellar hook-associated protein FlgK [Sphingomonas sp.]
MSSDLLSIGASGLRAYKTALNTVGDNIANAQTVGYARRSARLTEVSTGAGQSILYRNVDRFDGVEVQAIDRATDRFRVGEARLAATADGKAKAISGWMAITETALADGDDGVGARLGAVFAGGAALAADPVARQPRTAFLSAIDAAAQAIRTSAGDLQRATEGVGDAAQSSVAGLNGTLSTLADINLAIRHAGPGTATYVELSDQRDALIDAVAGQLNIDIVVATDGTTTLSSNGQMLLNGATATSITLTVASDGRLSLAAGAPLTPTGGTLSGLATTAAVIADRRAALDVLASDFASHINQWQGAGRTPGGTAGTALLSAVGGAAGLVALATDADAVAAGSAGGVPNGNALDLATVRTTSDVEGQWNTMVGLQAQATAAATSQRATTTARLTTANAARDGVEGVDLDHEAVDLLRFQQAYEGSAKILQVARDILDTIMGLFK